VDATSAGHALFALDVMLYVENHILARAWLMYSQQVQERLKRRFMCIDRA